MIIDWQVIWEMTWPVQDILVRSLEQVPLKTFRQLFDFVNKLITSCEMVENILIIPCLELSVVVSTPRERWVHLKWHNLLTEWGRGIPRNCPANFATHSPLGKGDGPMWIQLSFSPQADHRPGTRHPVSPIPKKILFVCRVVSFRHLQISQQPVEPRRCFASVWHYSNLPLISSGQPRVLWSSLWRDRRWKGGDLWLWAARNVLVIRWPSILWVVHEHTHSTRRDSTP